MEAIKVFGIMLTALATMFLWVWAAKWVSERVCEAIGKPDSIPAYILVVSVLTSAVVSVAVTAFK